MGAAYAPTYAVIYMDSFEKKFIYPTDFFKHRVILYKRFIDDLIFICKGDILEFCEFFESLNLNEHNLSFSYEMNRNQINFLDLTLFERNNIIEFRPYRKSTSVNMFLHATSMHPPHLLRALPHGEFKRIYQHTSIESELDYELNEVFLRLCERGYEKKQLLKSMNNVMNKHKTFRKFEMDVLDLTKQDRDVEEIFFVTRRCEEESQYKQNECEALKNDLLLQLSQSSQKVGQLEAELTDKGDVQKERDALVTENTELRSLVTTQSERIILCQKEVEDTKTELRSLESYVSQMPMVDVNERTSAKLNHASCPQENISASGNADTATDKSVIADLRLKLAVKEAEVQKLQAERTCEKAAEQLSSASPNTDKCGFITVKSKLTMNFERSQAEEDRKWQQLDPIIKQTEKERSRYIAQIVELQGSLAEAEAEISSLQARMAQRTSQFQVIQEEMLEKAANTTNLERELKKLLSQLQTLEKQLEEKTVAYSSCAAQNAELEQQLVERNSCIFGLEVSVKEEQESNRLALDNVKKIHMQQHKELESQLEMLQMNLDNLQSQLNERNKAISTLQQQLRVKEQQVESQNLDLMEAKQELEKHTKETDEALRRFMIQATEGAEKIKHLELALVMYREEINRYILQLEDNKESFENQLKKKSEELQCLRKELTLSTASIQEANDQNIQLQQMLEQGTSRINELEDFQTEMEKQVSKLERKLQQQRESFDEEIRNAKEKFRKVCNETDFKKQQVLELTNTIKQMEMELDSNQEAITGMEKELLLLRRDSETKNIQLNLLEDTLQQTQTELDKKADLVVDLEEQLHRSEADRRNSLQRQDELESELQNVRVELKDTLGQLQELREVLQKAHLSLEEKTEVAEQLSSELRHCRAELESRDQELLEMDSILKERNWELKQRAVQVTQLDMTVREHKAEMEQKITELQCALEKSELEMKELVKQTEMLDEKLQFTRTQLQEKDFELLQKEQQTKIELEEKEQRIADCEKIVKEQEMMIAEQRQKELEQRQQLRLAREQIQASQLDLMETQQRLSQTLREADRLGRELEETLHLIHEKEARTHRLAEELGATQAREAQLEMSVQTERKKYKEEIEQLKDSHQQEVTRLQEGHVDLLLSSENQKSNVHQLSRQLCQLKQDLDKAKDIVQSLQTELQAKNEVIQATTEALIVKKEDRFDQLQNSVDPDPMICSEAEVTRLQTRVSGYERSVGVQLSSEIFVSSSQKMPSLSVLQHSTYRCKQRNSSGGLSDIYTQHNSSENEVTLTHSILDNVKQISQLTSDTDYHPDAYGKTAEFQVSDTEDDSSINYVGYSVDKDVSSDKCCTSHNSCDLETLSGMLKYINKETRVSEPSVFSTTAERPTMASKSQIAKQ
ncbi:coiled-coil domain-containing protein 18 [Protopterus annectens]|uniref:coiled-coil domain-containing protein 18 n=1 Tax=Protopterus annectens TaxID=7888 RepID=UPI001CFAD12D|nr:coiled-coil domain-containing protein 18 [Protopterus annectens]